MSRRVEQIFSARAARWQERVAIESGDRCLTYGALDEWSNRLAAGLVQAGVVENDIVAVASGDI